MFLRIQHIFRRQPICWLAAIIFLVTACSPSSPLDTAPSITPTRSGYLTPYHTQPARPGVTAAPASSQPTATPQPSATATPRIHVVKKGEDMGGIAFQYRVSLEALMAANPTVQPNIMSIGTELVIPPSKNQAPPESTTPKAVENPPTPTPVAVSQGQVSCSQAEDGGIWCFMPLHNTQTYPLEAFTAVFRMVDPQSQTVVSQMAYLPLDRLEPETTLPLAAYFPPDQVDKIVPPFQVTGELTSALPGADDGRYVPAHIANQKVMLAENGLSAILTADITLDGSRKAARVWVAAVAYDAQGTVVGVRRWEKPAEPPLESGQTLPVTMHVYSAAAKIDRVELHAEARP